METNPLYRSSDLVSPIFCWCDGAHKGVCAYVRGGGVGDGGRAVATNLSARVLLAKEGKEGGDS